MFRQCVGFCLKSLRFSFDICSIPIEGTSKEVRRNTEESVYQMLAKSEYDTVNSWLKNREELDWLTAAF